mmetsp:Transcript_28758/g.43519  ORF Transcript_28758/g.43519 Transcript_28758/m.43519 type:complete len:241 (+) Transcript_28758:21-743(+)
MEPKDHTDGPHTFGKHAHKLIHGKVIIYQRTTRPMQAGLRTTTAAVTATASGKCRRTETMTSPGSSFATAAAFERDWSSCCFAAAKAVSLSQLLAASGSPTVEALFGKVNPSSFRQNQANRSSSTTVVTNCPAAIARTHACCHNAASAQVTLNPCTGRCSTSCLWSVNARTGNTARTGPAALEARTEARWPKAFSKETSPNKWNSWRKNKPHNSRSGKKCEASNIATAAISRFPAGLAQC